MLRKEREILGGHLSQQIYKDVLSQPLYTSIKTEVRMCHNTYEIAIKFLILCLTLPSTSMNINTSSKL